MLEQMRQEDRDRQTAMREQKTAQNSSGSVSQEGYWSYMQRQIQERTERLGMTNDCMDRLENTSSGWMEDVDKFVKNQKRKAVMGGESHCSTPFMRHYANFAFVIAIGSKFGF